MIEYTLSQFNSLVKETLKDQLDPSYWIIAEIGEMNLHSSGHCYLTLIEKLGNKEKAKMRATIWSFTFNNLHNNFVSSTGSPLQPGMKILFNAVLEFHELYGLSLNVRDIDPNYTLGEREKSRQETINRLQAEELLELNKQFALPMVLDRIAVISSESAAGYGDYINQLVRNEYGYKVNTTLFQATMQGDQAVDSIITQLEIIDSEHQDFDAAVVIRGGGSKTDLDCFDQYELCAALAQCSLPVITGIGHERDQTVADLVANVSLKTPTAVAEFILSSMLQFESEIQLAMDRISNITRQKLESARLDLKDIRHRIALLTTNQINTNQTALTISIDQIENLAKRKIENEGVQIELLKRLVASYEPETVLKRGFTITKVNGQNISSDLKLKVGDEMETEYLGGTVKSKIE